MRVSHFWALHENKDRHLLKGWILRTQETGFPGREMCHYSSLFGTKQILKTLSDGLLTLPSISLPGELYFHCDPIRYPFHRFRRFASTPIISLFTQSNWIDFEISNCIWCVMCNSLQSFSINLEKWAFLCCSMKHSALVLLYSFYGSDFHVKTAYNPT